MCDCVTGRATTRVSFAGDVMRNGPVFPCSDGGSALSKAWHPWHLCSGGNVRAVAVYKPSGERALRGCVYTSLMHQGDSHTHEVAHGSAHVSSVAQLALYVSSNSSSSHRESQCDSPLCCLGGSIDCVCADAFTSDGERRLDSIDQGSTWGQSTIEHVWDNQPNVIDGAIPVAEKHGLTTPFPLSLTSRLWFYALL